MWLSFTVNPHGCKIAIWNNIAHWLIVIKVCRYSIRDEESDRDSVTSQGDWWE